MSDSSDPEIKDSWTRTFPKRFYKVAEVCAESEGYSVKLDGRTLKTPHGFALNVHHRQIAEDIAGEFAAQEDEILPGSMPTTRLINSALDTVREEPQKIAEEVASYAGSDLLCYRAVTPVELANRQAAHWDGILGWAKEALGADFEVVSGIVHQQQPASSLQQVQTAVSELDVFSLAAVHLLTTMTGSVVVALAISRQAIEPDTAWNAAHVDEDWQIEHWGHDSEAQQRRRHRRVEFDTACRLLACDSGNV